MPAAATELHTEAHRWAAAAPSSAGRSAGADHATSVANRHRGAAREEVRGCSMGLEAQADARGATESPTILQLPGYR